MVVSSSFFQEKNKAYLDMLSKKAPQVPCRAICFWPFGGFRQCLWARECCIAERQQSTNCAGVVDIQEWFSTLSRKPPKRFEGFVSVLNVRSYLSSPVPFDHPCLFVDAGSLCGFEAVPGTDSFHCVVKRREDTEWVLRDWYVEFWIVAFFFLVSFFQCRCSENPRGLIAILALESQLFPASVEMYADEDDPLVYFELLELYHSALVSSLREVVGKIGGGRAELLGTRYNSGDMHWWNCPSPGMIAFAQRVHKIDLNASMMVCSESSGFWGLARELGLSTIRDELLFQSKRTCGWSLSDRLRKMSVSPSVNKNSDWLFTRLLSEGGEEKECEKNGEVAGCFWTTLLDRNDTAAPTNVPRFGVDQVCARKCAFEEGFEEDDQLRENEDVVKKEDEPRPSQMQKLGD